jgi:phage tail-like protein
MAIPLTSPATGNGNGNGNGARGWGAPEPVGELRFQVHIPGVEIGRFTEVSGIQVEYEIVEYAEGGNDQFTYKLRGVRKYPNLVLKRGVTNEDALLKWFLRYEHVEARPSVTLTLVGPDASPVRTWGFSNAYPVKWQGPTFKAGSNAIATETLEIAHMGLTTQ